MSLESSLLAAASAEASNLTASSFSGHDQFSSSSLADSGLLDLSSFIDQNWSLYNNIDLEQLNSNSFELNQIDNLEFLNEEDQQHAIDFNLLFNIQKDDCGELSNTAQSALSPSNEMEINITEHDFSSISSLIGSPDTLTRMSSQDDEDSQAESMTAVRSVSSSSAIKRVRKRGGMVDKKESNRAAAIRYRNKKVMEREQLFTECELYANKNADLKKKIDDTLTEISFIKSLLVEALISKNK